MTDVNKSQRNLPAHDAFAERVRDAAADFTALGRAARWHRYFLRLAHEAASMSKDPTTKVGAVLVRNRSVLSMGYNGFPKGIRDTDERLADREIKLQLTVHAEMNAILQAAAAGTATAGSDLYFTWFSAESGETYGGPPCTRCAVELIQAGVSRVYSRRGLIPERWRESNERSLNILAEAGITFSEIEP